MIGDGEKLEASVRVVFVNGKLDEGSLVTEIVDSVVVASTGEDEGLKVEVGDVGAGSEVELELDDDVAAALEV